MSNRIVPPTDADRETARKVIEWMNGLASKTGLSDYEHNLAVYGMSGLVTFRGRGIVASAIAAYDRTLVESKAREAQKASVHVGAVGDTVDMHVTILGEYASDGQYGRTYIYRLVDDNGNIFTWFASKRLEKVGFFDENRYATGDAHLHDVGDSLWLTGKVKKHDTYRDVKQTVLTRCSAVLSPEERAAYAAKVKAEKAAAAKAKREEKKAQKAAEKSAQEVQEKNI